MFCKKGVLRNFAKFTGKHMCQGRHQSSSWTSVHNSFKEKPEFVQYNSYLDLARAIRYTSKEKIYQELGLESVRDQRWCRKLCLFLQCLEK